MKPTIADFVVSKNSDGSIDKATTIRRAELYKKVLKSQKELENTHAEKRRDKIARGLLAAIVLCTLAVLLWFMGG